MLGIIAEHAAPEKQAVAPGVSKQFLYTAGTEAFRGQAERITNGRSD
jgi:hypothetical protein